MERSTELLERVLAGFEAFSSGDASLVDRDTSRHEGVRLIGTDPDEWFEGEQAAEVLKQEVQDTTDIGVTPRDLDASSKARSVGSLVASCGPWETKGRSPLTGPPSFIKKTVSGRWCRRTHP
jgi:hypothetical protein